MPPVNLNVPAVIEKPAVAREIVAYLIDTKALSVAMTINAYDEDGKIVESVVRTSQLAPLVDGTPTPRFDPQVYADTKALLYQIAQEDGWIEAGTVL